MTDRELNLTRSWADDPERRADAGVPEEIAFATKPALATATITRAVTAGVPARWVAGDEVYGADPTLRAQIQGLGLGYVLAIGCNRRVLTHGGPIRPTPSPTPYPNTPGNDVPPAPARRDRGSTTGPGSPSPAPTPAPPVSGTSGC